MTRKARLWTGATILLIIFLNYALIGVPLIKKSASLREKAKSIIMSKSADDEFVLELFRRERRDADNKLAVLNAITASLAIVAASWTAFGLIFHRKKQKEGP